MVCYHLCCHVSVFSLISLLENCSLLSVSVSHLLPPPDQLSIHPSISTSMHLPSLPSLLPSVHPSFHISVHLSIIQLVTQAVGRPAPQSASKYIGCWSTCKSVHHWTGQYTIGCTDTQSVSQSANSNPNPDYQSASQTAIQAYS